MDHVLDEAFEVFAAVMGENSPPGTLRPTRAIANPRFRDAFDAAMARALAVARPEDVQTAKVASASVEARLELADAKRSELTAERIAGRTKEREG